MGPEFDFDDDTGTNSCEECSFFQQCIIPEEDCVLPEDEVEPEWKKLGLQEPQEKAPKVE